jgi:hypothetical protein
VDVDEVYGWGEERKEWEEPKEHILKFTPTGRDSGKMLLADLSGVTRGVILPDLSQYSQALHKQDIAHVIEGPYAAHHVKKC